MKIFLKWNFAQFSFSWEPQSSFSSSLIGKIRYFQFLFQIRVHVHGHGNWHGTRIRLQRWTSSDQDIGKSQSDNRHNVGFFCLIWEAPISGSARYRIPRIKKRMLIDDSSVCLSNVCLVYLSEKHLCLSSYWRSLSAEFAFRHIYVIYE